MSFQRSENITKALKLISVKQVWNEVGAVLGVPPADVKTHLDIIVDRRNKIAHEADMNPVYPGSRWPISPGEVNDSIKFITDLVEALDVVIG